MREFGIKKRPPDTVPDASDNDTPAPPATREPSFETSRIKCLYCD